jgi:hypothetical protein
MECPGAASCPERGPKPSPPTGLKTIREDCEKGWEETRKKNGEKGDQEAGEEGHRPSRQKARANCQKEATQPPVRDWVFLP